MLFVAWSSFCSFDKCSLAKLQIWNWNNLQMQITFSLYLYFSKICSCHCSKLTKVSVQCTMMVIIAERIHLFPFRTQKLSSHTSTIFGWRRPEKIDRCHQPDKDLRNQVFICFWLNKYLDRSNMMKEFFWLQEAYQPYPVYEAATAKNHERNKYCPQ